MATKKSKKETEAKNTSVESDADFLKRIMSIKETATQKASGNLSAYTKEMEEAKMQGAGFAKEMAEIEECGKLAEEFKKNPPLLTIRTIGGISVESYYNPKIQPKIDLLKKHSTSFASVTNRMAIEPIIFSTFGNAYIKRGLKKVNLPKSSDDLPFIIKDGDIVGTENKSFVLSLKNVNQDLDNDYWDIFLFPNSELRVSITEKVSHPAPAYMDPKKVPDIIKKGSSSTVYEHRIEKVELLGGIFNIKVKKKGRNVNNLVQFPSGFPKIEFYPYGSLINEIAKAEMEKAVKALGAQYLSKASGKLGELTSLEKQTISDEINAIIELNKDGSLVIFNAGNAVSIAGSKRRTKKISTDINNPVKITAMGGFLYETDGSKNPDPRVTAIMKIWMNISQYIYFINAKNEIGMKSSGRSLSVEEAEKTLEYAKTLGDKDMASAAEIILQRKKNDEAMNKGMAMRAADKEGQRREAEEQLKFAEESGEEELIKVAKAQLKAIDAPSLGASPAQFDKGVQQKAEGTLNKIGSLFEVSLPPYKHPSGSDVV